METTKIQSTSTIQIEHYQLLDAELVIEFWSNEMPRRVGVDVDKVKAFAIDELEQEDDLKHFMQIDDSGETENISFNFSEWYEDRFDMETAKRLLIHLFKNN